MKALLFAALVLGVSLTANSTTFADTHLTAPAPAFSRIPGSEKPLLRLARQDETCIENLCKARSNNASERGTRRIATGPASVSKARAKPANAITEEPMR